MTVGEADCLSMMNGLLSAIRILFLLFMPTQGGMVGGEVGAGMEVKRLVELCGNREQGLALSKLRKVARNMTKRCANAAMMNTIIARIEPPGLNGDICTIWHTICASQLTRALDNFFSVLFNDGPSMQGGNGVSQFDLRHYDSCNSLVSRRGSREVMDETWTAELLLQDTVIAFNSSQHTLDKAQRLLDSVGLNNMLSIQLRLAGVQRDWINSMDEDDLWDWHLI